MYSLQKLYKRTPKILEKLCLIDWKLKLDEHPEGTSIGSDNCDFSKNPDYNGCLWNINFLSQKPHEQ